MNERCYPFFTATLRWMLELLKLNRKDVIIICLICLVALNNDLLYAQTVMPKIKPSQLYDDQLIQKEKGAIRYGVEIFGNGSYKDSLIHYFDTILHLEGKERNAFNRYQAIWQGDTLTYRVRPQVCKTETYDPEQKKKVQVLEVESQLSPHTRFSAIIEGLQEESIEALKDSMLRMKSDSPISFNNNQTCIFYALEGIFRTNQVNPEPIITRNTNFCNPKELNAFFDRFFTIESKHTCRWKTCKDITLPDNCILVFLDDYNEIIHAVFYHNRLFYTKNGLFVPAVFSSLQPILKHYSRWDGDNAQLNKEGKRLQGHTLIVYTLNTKLFKRLAENEAL